ncbi:hypothetical protein [Haemophilus haemolyticus]|uniref:hypothetical protein n=1 Tax=Haemophilus haemolyticus TaxID=726 RepID=UPI001864B55B
MDDSINYNELANLTENFVSGDIKFICDEASRKALKNNSKISQSILIETTSNTSPSLSLDELKEYDKVKEQFLNKNSKNKPIKNTIGFF